MQLLIHVLNQTMHDFAKPLLMFGNRWVSKRVIIYLYHNPITGLANLCYQRSPHSFHSSFILQIKSLSESVNDGALFGGENFRNYSTSYTITAVDMSILRQIVSNLYWWPAVHFSCLLEGNHGRSPQICTHIIHYRLRPIQLTIFCSHFKFTRDMIFTLDKLRMDDQCKIWHIMTGMYRKLQWCDG